MERDQQTHAPQHQRIGEGESRAPEKVSQLRSAMPPDGEERSRFQQAANQSPQVTQLRHLHQAAKGGPVKQLKAVRHNSKKNVDAEKQFGKDVQKIAKRVDNLVQESYLKALSWEQFHEEGKGYLKTWYKTAKAYSEKPDTLPSFFHARFGYAVETLVNRVLESANLPLDVELQATHGHTRPDIVLSEKGSNPRNEVAWLDITSEASQGHIFAKDGGGWKNRPFVYEITYPALDPTKILTGSDDPMMGELGEYQASRMKLISQGLLRADNKMRRDLVGYKEKKDWVVGIGDQTQKRGEIRKHLASNYHQDFKNEAAARGALDFLELDRRAFGFHKPTNKLKTSKKAYEAWRKSTALELASKQIKSLDKKVIKSLFNFIKKAYKKFGNPQICQNWLKEAMHAQADYALVTDGIRIKGVLETRASLENAIVVLKKHKDKKAAQVAQQVASNSINSFPKEVGDIVSWRHKVRKLEAEIPQIVTNLDAFDDFQEYLIIKEMDSKDKISKFEYDLKTRLEKLPPDATAAQDARNYIENNPLVKKTGVEDNDVKMTNNS